jgi:hypothetical protein
MQARTRRAYQRAGRRAHFLTRLPEAIPAVNVDTGRSISAGHGPHSLVRGTDCAWNKVRLGALTSRSGFRGRVPTRMSSGSAIASPSLAAPGALRPPARSASGTGSAEHEPPGQAAPDAQNPVPPPSGRQPGPLPRALARGRSSMAWSPSACKRVMPRCREQRRTSCRTARWPPPMSWQSRGPRRSEPVSSHTAPARRDR